MRGTGDWRLRSERSLTYDAEVTTPSQTAPSQTRAPRMSVEDRRESILDTAIPLFMSHGSDVTTKQIAEAAGVAEGTIFRAFADKHELIHAVVERYMDPAPTLAALEAIDVELPLEDKVAQVVHIIRTRFAGVIGIMDALGLKPPPKAHEHPHAVDKKHHASGVTLRLFEPHGDHLRIEPAAVVQYVRLMCFAVSVPAIVGDRPVSDGELVDFILRGISKEGQ